MRYIFSFYQNIKSNKTIPSKRDYFQFSICFEVESGAINAFNNLTKSDYVSCYVLQDFNEKHNQNLMENNIFLLIFIWHIYLHASRFRENGQASDQ